MRLFGKGWLDANSRRKPRRKNQNRKTNHGEPRTEETARRSRQQRSTDGSSAQRKTRQPQTSEAAERGAGSGSKEGGEVGHRCAAHNN